MEKLSIGDTVRLVPPRNVGNQAVKAHVNCHVGPRLFEVETETGGMFQQNRHFNKAEFNVTRHNEVPTAPGGENDPFTHPAMKPIPKTPVRVPPTTEPSGQPAVLAPATENLARTVGTGPRNPIINT